MAQPTTAQPTTFKYNTLLVRKSLKSWDEASGFKKAGKIGLTILAVIATLFFGLFTGAVDLINWAKYKIDDIRERKFCDEGGNGIPTG